MKWLARWWKWLCFAAAALGIGILSVFLWAASKKRELAEVKSELGMMKAKLDIEGLKAKKQAIDSKLKDIGKKAGALEQKAADIKAKAEADVSKINSLDANEVIEELKKLGY